MKRLSTIFLTCLILASSTWTTIAFHYCGKSLQDVAVFGKANPCCEGMEMPSGCCHDEKFQIKSDEFQIAQVVGVDFVPVLICEYTFVLYDFEGQFGASLALHPYYPDYSHPPAAADIIILKHSFLI